MLRIALTLHIAIVTLSAGPAAADDSATCHKASGPVAVAACDRAIKSGQFTGIELAKLHTSRGVERKRAGDIDGAIADYDAAIKLNPKDFFAFNNRGNTWRDKGALDRAIADYSEAIRLDPDYAAPYINRGLVYERQKDFARARSDFKAALATSPHKYNNSRGAHQMARKRLAALARISPE
jgi:tetratricopeptide (TPR) repeat protein